MAPGTWKSILRQSGLKTEDSMKYAIVFERTPNGYSAYVPDLPGCVAAADSYETAKQLIHEAVVFHLEALHGDGDPIPEPSTSVGSVKVSVPR